MVHHLETMNVCKKLVPIHQADGDTVAQEGRSGSFSIWIYMSVKAFIAIYSVVVNFNLDQKGGLTNTPTLTSLEANRPQV